MFCETGTFNIFSNYYQFSISWGRPLDREPWFIVVPTSTTYWIRDPIILKAVDEAQRDITFAMELWVQNPGYTSMDPRDVIYHLLGTTILHP